MYLHHLPRINTFSIGDNKNIAFTLNKLPTEERIWFMQQIEARSKLRQKLPSWIKNDIVFPPSINLEQSSSEISAKAKLDLLEGNSIWDLTGGFGVDSTIFAQAGFIVTHVEPNSSLQDLFLHNSSILAATALIKTENSTCEEFLDTLKDERVDSIYIDPSRRDKSNQKAILLDDYSPNLFHILPKMLERASVILIKVSPMLDIHYLIQALPFVFSISIISVKNECKEVLIKIKKSFSGTPSISTLNYLSESEVQEFSFDYSFEKNNPISANFENLDITNLENMPLFLYDVNSSIHKAQAYDLITQTFGLTPISSQSHIFLASRQIHHFPGRSFWVIDVIPYKKNALDPKLIKSGFNIVPRNFIDSEVIIRKKLGIKKNGTHYLYAVRNQEERPMLFVCEPI
jgi:hypothetical protein